MRRCAIACAALLAACELPTDPPSWHTTWVVPVDTFRIGVSEILPTGVRVEPGGGAFEVDIAPHVLTRSLAELCGAVCPFAGAATLPKPAIHYSTIEPVPLPPGVSGAAIASGTILLGFEHDFDFDPLRPPGASTTGRLTAVLRDAASGRDVATTVIDGAAVAFPPGTSITRVVPMAAGSVGDTLLIELTIDSPAGSPTQPVRLDTADRIRVAITPTAVRVASAQVVVADEPIAIAPIRLNLAGLEDEVIDRVEGGTLVLEVRNPFSATARVDLTIETPTGDIVKPLVIPGGESTHRVQLGEAELERILGRSGVTLSLSGTVSGTGGNVTVRPGQTIEVVGRLEIDALMGV